MSDTHKGQKMFTIIVVQENKLTVKVDKKSYLQY